MDATASGGQVRQNDVGRPRTRRPWGATSPPRRLTSELAERGLRTASGWLGAWPIEANAQQFNVAFPDRDATYWAMLYLLLPQSSLVVTGAYPFARYCGFTTYGWAGLAVDGMRDAAIVPDPQSADSGATAGATGDLAGRRYTVEVAPGVAPGVRVNTLAGLVGGRRLGIGTLIYRVYVPNDPGDPKGGVPLPSVAIRERSGQLVPLAPAGPVRQRRLSAILALLARVITRRVKPGALLAANRTHAPQFGLPPSLGGLLANPDNTYLAAPISWAPGRVVVVRGKAPVFPNTRAGAPTTTPAQLRYWSLSVGELRNPYPVVGGTPDFEVAVDAGGYYTFAVSTAADRPRNATPAESVSWLRWGDTAVPNVLILRNMLPSPDFHQAVQAVPAGATPDEIRAIMGPYYPVAVYCDRERFEAGGARGCFDGDQSVPSGPAWPER